MVIDNRQQKSKLFPIMCVWVRTTTEYTEPRLEERRSQPGSSLQGDRKFVLQNILVFILKLIKLKFVLRYKQFTLFEF